MGGEWGEGLGSSWEGLRFRVKGLGFIVVRQCRAADPGASKAGRISYHEI